MVKGPLGGDVGRVAARVTDAVVFYNLELLRMYFFCGLEASPPVFNPVKGCSYTHRLHALKMSSLVS